MPSPNAVTSLVTMFPRLFTLNGTGLNADISGICPVKILCWENWTYVFTFCFLSFQVLLIFVKTFPSILCQFGFFKYFGGISESILKSTSITSPLSSTQQWFLQGTTTAELQEMTLPCRSYASSSWAHYIYLQLRCPVQTSDSPVEFSTSHPKYF